MSKMEELIAQDAIDHIDAAKRLGMFRSEVIDDWWCGYSPRNGYSGVAEGYWHEWVALARLILAEDERRKANSLAGPPIRP